MCASSHSIISFPSTSVILTLITKTVQFSVTPVNFGFTLNAINRTTLIISTFKDLMILGTASHAVMKFYHLAH